MRTNAEEYYAATWPAKLFAHHRGEFVEISMSEDPEDSALIIAQIPNDERGAFVIELVRRWNHSPKREQALMDIREMAQKRKTCIRMPDGVGLDLFCGVALLDD